MKKNSYKYNLHHFDIKFVSEFYYHLLVIGLSKKLFYYFGIKNLINYDLFIIFIVKGSIKIINLKFIAFAWL